MHSSLEHYSEAPLAGTSSLRFRHMTHEYAPSAPVIAQSDIDVGHPFGEGIFPYQPPDPQLKKPNLMPNNRTWMPGATAPERRADEVLRAQRKNPTAGTGGDAAPKAKGAKPKAAGSSILALFFDPYRPPNDLLYGRGYGGRHKFMLEDG